MGSDGAIKRVQALFSGRVQGVGFRCTACRIATALDLTGYVRNRPDGDVELVAEGAEQKLAGLLDGIRDSRLNNHIFRERIEWAAATGEYGKFGILD